MDWCPYIAGGELEAKQTEPGDWQYSVLSSNRSNKENGHHQYMDIMNIDQYSVAKCHEYDGYIRVKIFAGLGKKSERTRTLATLRLFWEDLHNL